MPMWEQIPVLSIYIVPFQAGGTGLILCALGTREQWCLCEIVYIYGGLLRPRGQAGTHSSHSPCSPDQTRTTVESI
jgi:hypothetical protein